MGPLASRKGRLPKDRRSRRPACFRVRATLDCAWSLVPAPAAADEAEAVHRVCWSRAAAGGAAWLASAGAAGLVRCQWVQAK